MGLHEPGVPTPDAMSRELVHLIRKPQSSSPDSVDSASSPAEYKQETSPVPWTGNRLLQAPNDDDSSSSPARMPASTKRGHRKTTHSADAWEAHKAEIARLYLDENKRLKDVMEIMESQWGFRAS